MDMRDKIVYTLGLIFLTVVIFGCKKDDSTPDKVMNPKANLPDTIFPGEYAPYYPGSYWIYEVEKRVDQSGHIDTTYYTEIVKVDTGYHKLKYENANGDSVVQYLPRITVDTVSQPNRYEYIRGYESLTTQTSTLPNTFKPFLILDSDTIHKYWKEPVGPVGNLKDSNITFTSHNGKTYSNVVSWFVDRTNPDPGNNYINYYSKDIGLVQETISVLHLPIDYSSFTIKSLKDHKIIK